MTISKIELLNEQCECVSLTKHGDEWSLKTNHEKFGEREFTGKLKTVVSLAANPIINDLNPAIDFDLLNNSDVPFKQNLVDAISDHEGWFLALADICRSFYPADKNWLISRDWSKFINLNPAAAYAESGMKEDHKNLWAQDLADIINEDNPGENITREEVARDWAEYFMYGNDPMYAYRCEAAHGIYKFTKK